MEIFSKEVLFNLRKFEQPLFQSQGTILGLGQGIPRELELLWSICTEEGF